jgi:hypothetical protein
MRLYLLTDPSMDSPTFSLAEDRDEAIDRAAWELWLSDDEDGSGISTVTADTAEDDRTRSMLAMLDRIAVRAMSSGAARDRVEDELRSLNTLLMPVLEEYERAAEVAAREQREACASIFDAKAADIERKIQDMRASVNEYTEMDALRERIQDMKLDAGVAKAYAAEIRARSTVKQG